jgi:preprotein translocase subunit SecA
MGFLDTVLKSFLGDKNAKDLKEIKKVVDKIKKVEPAIEQLSDDELRGKTQEFKRKLLQLLKTSPNK